MIQKTKNNVKSFHSGVSPSGVIIAITFIFAIIFIIYDIILAPLFLITIIYFPQWIKLSLMIVVVPEHGIFLLIWLMFVIICLIFIIAKKKIKNDYDVNIKNNSIITRMGQYSETIPINVISSVAQGPSIPIRILLSVRFNTYSYFGAMGSRKSVLIEFNNKMYFFKSTYFHSEQKYLILDIDDPERFIKIINPLLRVHN